MALNNKIVSPNNRLILGVLFLAIYIIAASRGYDVGTDTKEYVNGFLHPQLAVQGRNTGYNFFLALIRYVHDNSRFFIYVTSFVMLFPIYRAIEIHSKSVLYTFILFVLLYYCFSLNILRQFIVLGFFYWFGIGLIKEKKLLRYLILISILFTFHELSLIFLPIYFISRKLFNKWVYISILSASVLIFFLNTEFNDVFYFIDKILRSYLSNLPNYLNEISSITDSDVSTNGLIFDQLILIFILYSLFYSKEKRVLSSSNTILFNLFFIGIIFQNFFYKFQTIQRVSLFFLFSGIFLIPYFLKSNLLKVFYIILCGILFYVRFVLHGVSGVF